MDYELFLAHEQWERFQAFRVVYMNRNGLTEIPVQQEERVRVEFFGQRYEVHITHSISKGLEQAREFKKLNQQ